MKDDVYDDLNLSNQFKPSAISLSFRVSNSDSVYARFFLGGMKEKLEVDSDEPDQLNIVYKRIQERRYLRINLSSKGRIFRPPFLY